MASLTHVCMWSDNGWKRITAEQAARLHPGGTVSPIKPETQINMIMPLANILKQSGCEITADSEITATGRRIKKKIVIYPAMWVEPHATNTIFVSDAYIKYAKPYAVQKILDNI